MAWTADLVVVPWARNVHSPFSTGPREGNGMLGPAKSGDYQLIFHLALWADFIWGKVRSCLPVFSQGKGFMYIWLALPPSPCLGRGRPLAISMSYNRRSTLPGSSWASYWSFQSFTFNIRMVEYQDGWFTTSSCDFLPCWTKHNPLMLWEESFCFCLRPSWVTWPAPKNR